MNAYPIKIAAHRSGLNSHTIRMWEKRYNAVSPQRTPANRRLYSDADISRLKLLHSATQAGHSIGMIAHLQDGDLHNLLADPVDPVVEEVGQEGGGYIGNALEAIRQLDGPSLEAELRRGAFNLGYSHVVTDVIEPLMRKVGELWQQGSLRIADEHLATSVIRRFIDGIRLGCQVPPGAPKLIVATPLGQMHEIGALLVATVAASHDWQVVYLGANMPAEAIGRAVERTGARAVALSIVYPGADPALSAELLKLRQLLGEQVSVLVGGRVFEKYSAALQQIGALQLSGLCQLAAQLDHLELVEKQ